jgi:hypothetical protein
MAFAQSQLRHHLKLLRVLIVVYLLCAIWFKVTPDAVPDALRRAELLLDKPQYVFIDNTIVALLYARALLCALLWKPTRAIAWLFASVVAMIVALGGFAGTSLLAGVDTVIDTVQSMAMTAILTLLYVGGVFANVRTHHAKDYEA